MLPLSLVPGIVTEFGGAIGSIPHGWFLCDGNNGTPDLRDKFLVSDGPNFSVGDEGGDPTHIHPFTGDGHTHSLVAGTNFIPPVGFGMTTEMGIATGITDPSSSLPKYWALAYIQYQGI